MMWISRSVFNDSKTNETPKNVLFVSFRVIEDDSRNSHVLFVSFYVHVYKNLSNKRTVLFCGTLVADQKCWTNLPNSDWTTFVSDNCASNWPIRFPTFSFQSWNRLSKYINPSIWKEISQNERLLEYRTFLSFINLYAKNDSNTRVIRKWSKKNLKEVFHAIIFSESSHFQFLSLVSSRYS